eukprot:GFKZ01012506.1.p2 GENE.GFKZ01012506.1~~GFKZ01012506.1.p2  ORF type:complete len:128 (-),score=8.07 GFKZ01012506.1:189-572(-)
MPGCEGQCTAGDSVGGKLENQGGESGHEPVVLSGGRGAASRREESCDSAERSLGEDAHSTAGVKSDGQEVSANCSAWAGISSLFLSFDGQGGTAWGLAGVRDGCGCVGACDEDLYCATSRGKLDFVD